jgi:IPTL-CTERM motif
MLNKVLIFLFLTLIVINPSFAIGIYNPAGSETTYNFSSPTYVAASGVYNTSMRVTGSVTTNKPFLPNLNQEFLFNPGTDFIRFSFFDGVQTIDHTNGIVENFRNFTKVSTDSTGQITEINVLVKKSPFAANPGETDNLIGYALSKDAKYTFTSFGYGVQGITCAQAAVGECFDHKPNVTNLGITNTNHFTEVFSGSISYVPDTGPAGFVSFEAQGGQIVSNFSVAAADGTKPAGMYSPQGKISYTVSTAAPGGTATTQISFSSALPANFTLYKVDNAGVYTMIPQQAGADAWVQIDVNTIAITLTDGGTFDLDGVVNSSVTDPIVVMARVAATSIPTLSIWGLLILTAFIGLFGVNYKNRKKI